MPAIETGTIVVKKAGREAGKKAVVLSVEKGFALIDGPNVRRRKCNVRHLFPTGKKVNVTKDTKKEEIVKLMS